MVERSGMRATSPFAIVFFTIITVRAMGAVQVGTGPTEAELDQFQNALIEFEENQLPARFEQFIAEVRERLERDEKTPASTPWVLLTGLRVESKQKAPGSKVSARRKRLSA